MNKIEKLTAEIARLEKQLTQATHQENRLKNAMSYAKKKPWQIERNARTHRVANKGGAIEEFFPETIDFSEDQFRELLLRLIAVDAFEQIVSAQITAVKNEQKEVH